MRDFTPRSPSISRDGARVAYLGSGGEVRIRNLTNGQDVSVATVTQPIAGVSWIDDSQLLLTGPGGRGETKRHEQTPDYSGAKIIYTATERIPGPPAGRPVRDSARAAVRRTWSDPHRPAGARARLPRQHRLRIGLA